MRLLVLSKRQYTNKDLLDDRYGRIFEIATEIAATGVEVTGLALSYRKRGEGQYLFEAGPTKVPWYSVDIAPGPIPDIRGYLKQAERLISRFQPDFIWASSDALHIIIASKLGSKFGIKVIADLYDNYDAFGAAKIPGIKAMFRSALSSSWAITCASEAIAGLYRPKFGNVIVLENGVDTDIFAQLDREKCRLELGLPVSMPIIGTAGSLSRDRDIGLLFRAFERLSLNEPNLQLVLAGKLGRRIKLPVGKNVHYLGEVSYSKVPIIFNAIDVAVVCNKRSEFGNFCFPQKMYEILSCKTPIVVADTLAIKPILGTFPGSLYLPGDLDSLENTIAQQLERPELPGIHPKSWRDQAKTMIDQIRKRSRDF